MRLSPQSIQSSWPVRVLSEQIQEATKIIIRISIWKTKRPRRKFVDFISEKNRLLCRNLLLHPRALCSSAGSAQCNRQPGNGDGRSNWTHGRSS